LKRRGRASASASTQHFNRHIESKTEAETLAGDLRKAIRTGTFGQTAPVLDQLTVGQLLDTYNTRYPAVERKDSVRDVGYQIALIKRTAIERSDGRSLPFGDWPVGDVTTAVVEDFKARRSAAGIVTANRDLSLLRAMFTWGQLEEAEVGRREPVPRRRHGGGDVDAGICTDATLAARRGGGVARGV
jgi:hypothetical protein